MVAAIPPDMNVVPDFGLVYLNPEETCANNIACLQPFACLPNHVTGKGMIKELRRRYPQSNISAIDYDPGSSEVNQLNRLKLLLSNAPVGKHPDEKKNGKIWTPKGEVEPEIQYAAGGSQFFDDDPVDAANAVPAVTAELA